MDKDGSILKYLFISKLTLSYQIKSVLEERNLKTLYDLNSLSENEILDIEFFGKAILDFLNRCKNDSVFFKEQLKLCSLPLIYKFTDRANENMINSIISINNSKDINKNNAVLVKSNNIINKSFYCRDSDNKTINQNAQKEDNNFENCIEIFKYKEKPSVKQIIKDLIEYNSNLADNDREFCFLFDEIALNNGYEEITLPSYWTIGREIFRYKKENNIFAKEKTNQILLSTKLLDLKKYNVKW